MKMKYFINGIASIFCQSDILLKKNSNFEKDDYKALKTDWEKVGNEMRNSINSNWEKVGNEMRNAINENKKK